MANASLIGHSKNGERCEHVSAIRRPRCLKRRRPRMFPNETSVGIPMKQWVEISFDCLPLRSVGRLDIPLDASPRYRQKCERIKAAIEKHGSHNAYYLQNARCVFHLLNHETDGQLHFRFEGTVVTDTADERCQQCDLEVELIGETCPWLNEPVARWFADTVARAVAVEFDRYIQAGDLEKTRQRQQALESHVDSTGGYVGMYL